MLHFQYEQHSGVFIVPRFSSNVLVSTLGRGSVRTSGSQAYPRGLQRRCAMCSIWFKKRSSPWIGTIGTCLSYWEVARFIWVSSMGKWRWHHPTRLEWESMRTWMTFFRRQRNPSPAIIEEETTWDLAGRWVNPPIARSLYRRWELRMKTIYDFYLLW